MSAKPAKTRSKKNAKPDRSKAARAAMLCDAPRTATEHIATSGRIVKRASRPLFPEPRPHFPIGLPPSVLSFEELDAAEVRAWQGQQIPNAVTRAMIAAAYLAASGMKIDFAGGVGGCLPWPEGELGSVLYAQWGDIVGALVFATPIESLGAFACIRYRGQVGRKN